MGNIKPLSDKGSIQAAQENGFANEHEFKDSLGCGRSEYNMEVDIETNEIILTSSKGKEYNVSTEMTTTAR